jgi:hypothetical protein
VPPKGALDPSLLTPPKFLQKFSKKSQKGIILYFLFDKNKKGKRKMRTSAKIFYKKFSKKVKKE